MRDIIDENIIIRENVKMNEAKEYIIDRLTPYQDSISIMDETCSCIDDHIDAYTAKIQFSDKYKDISILTYDVNYYIYSGVLDASISSDNDNIQLSVTSESSYYIDKIIDAFHQSIYSAE